MVSFSQHYQQYKVGAFYRAANCAIVDCLSSFPILLCFFEASLFPLQVTLSHFVLSSYEWALRLPFSFSFQVWQDLSEIKIFCILLENVCFHLPANAIFFFLLLGGFFVCFHSLRNAHSFSIELALSAPGSPFNFSLSWHSVVFGRLNFLLPFVLGHSF